MKRVLRIAGLALLGGLLVISTFVFLWQKSRPPRTVTYKIEIAAKGDIEKKEP